MGLSAVAGPEAGIASVRKTGVSRTLRFECGITLKIEDIPVRKPLSDWMITSEAIRQGFPTPFKTLMLQIGAFRYFGPTRADQMARQSISSQSSSNDDTGRARPVKKTRSRPINRCAKPQFSGAKNPRNRQSNTSSTTTRAQVS